MEEKISRIIRMPEVVNRTGLSRSTIYYLMDKNQFPKSRCLGANSVGWYEHEVTEWIEGRVRRGQ